jgi:hypothetical protein
VVGIALAASPAPRTSACLPDGSSRPVGCIAAKRYAEQQLKVSPRTVDLSPEDQARFERERAHQQAVMATFTEPDPAVHASLRMQVPTPGGAPARSGCGGCSTGRHATHTAAWTSLHPRARRWWRRCQAG